ncbi:MAG: alpha/beta fold hydrolase [Phycisphaeraceae bacterium]|nr:alpha/beta fold hydrolase [Phycisphaeraceae bacterium]MCW5763014.1 alpha/beta fold hydrolase [Phycisphaeraceae bacterium]
MTLITLLLVVVFGTIQEGEVPTRAIPPMYVAVASEPIDQFPYDGFTTTDAFGRTIRFYLSKPPGPDSLLPLIVCVQGSGSQSVFVEVETPSGKRIGSGGPEAMMLGLARSRARILVVEKPGVEFLVQPSQPGSAMESTEEFRREHTLDRWTEAIHAAINAASVLPGVDASRVLAVGHSEGGQVVCHLAAKNASITHVATLAGGGPTQLFDLIELARSSGFGPPNADAEERVEWLLDGWRRVLGDPDAHDEFWLGHPHRRWSSFLATSPVEAMHKSKARVFIAQGTADQASHVSAAEVLYAELLSRGRDVTYLRIEGGDHGFRSPADADGWKSVHSNVLAWFLGE